jgi:3',5'-cyclic AMP phosphodiesterase CpdA
VANFAWDNISIFKNNGDGTFQSAVNYWVDTDPVVACPASIFCADLDGDTDLDLAVANAFIDNIPILKNNGDGTFQSATNYGAGNGPYSVFCADLDGDGDLDLAVANDRSDNVSILLNQTAHTNFYFVHISDPHVGAPGADKRFQLVIDSINALTPPPEFVVISGDLVSRGGHNPYWEKFDSLLDSLIPPVYVCVGNHDYRSFLWPVDPQYRHYFDDYDACPTINLHLISMNSGGNASWGDCDARVIDWFPEGSGISSSQMSWLTDIMDDHPGHNKILFMHHPIVCTDPYYRCEGEEESNGCITNHRNDLMNLCRNEDVKVVLSGHTHVPYQYTVDNANHPVTLSDNLAPNGYWSSYTVPDLPMYIITGACSQYLEYRKIEVQGEEVRVYKEGKFNGRYDLSEYETDYLSFLPWKEGQSWSKTDSILAPGRLHVYDSFGNHVGVNDVGGIDFQIPGAYYEDETAPIDSSDTSLLCTNGEIISLMLEPNQSYSYKIETFLPCSLNVTGNFVKKNGEGEVSTYYLGIPFSSGSVGKLFITNESIDYTLYIDDDGDSTVDREILPDTIITSLRGDANGDGVINVTDVVYLINYLFLIPPGPAPQPWAAGDANCDGTINVSDVVYLINYLFLIPPGPPPGC